MENTIMNNKFTVINNENANQAKIEHAYKVAKLNKLWERQYDNAILQAMEKNKSLKVADYSQDDLIKIALSGIKFICSQRDVKRENKILGTGYNQTLEISQSMYQLIDAIFMVCGHLTLRNFITTFPIKKDYNGEKWEVKDYFYTMEVLSEMDWDKPIGREQISELLWDYQNDDLRHAYIEYMGATSDIYRSQTGKGIMEQFCEENGIGTYTINQDLGIIRNNQTGEINKLSKKSSHLKIVK